MASLTVALMALVAWPTPVVGMVPLQDQEEGTCTSCHRALGDERLAAPVAEFEADIHKEQGFGCVICHGGDATDPSLGSMSPARGFVGRPAATDIPQVCGRCHSDAAFMRRYNPSLRVDQVAEYVTSVHGWRLSELGDSNVATCASCHGDHGVRPPSDPQSSVHPLRVADTCGACHADAAYMQSYGIPTDQREEYLGSVHWQVLSERGDLSAPTCNDCHGNHGAAPPGVAWVGNVCGQCHAVMADLFARSRHAQIFALVGEPGCATCHGNHRIAEATDEMLGLGEGAVCARCHVPAAGSGVAAAAMRALVDSLRTQFEAADSVLTRAENAGMEVSQAQFELRHAQTALVQARTAIHAFSVEAVANEVSTGLETAGAVRAQGESALAALRVRRLGLAVSSVLILMVIVGILLKIRDIEQRA